MYEVSLTQSYFPAQKDVTFSKNTIGELLSNVSKSNGSSEALVEVTQLGKVDRRWTYKALYRDSLRLAKSLASRFQKGEHIVLWSPNNP